MRSILTGSNVTRLKAQIVLKVNLKLKALWPKSNLKVDGLD